MAQCEGAVPQLAEVLILPAKQLLRLLHLPLESGNALCRLAEQPQDLGVVLDGLVEAVVVRVHDLVHDVLDEVALLFEELDLALAVLGGEDVHDVRQRVEPRGRPALVDPRQAFLEVGFVGRDGEAIEDAAARPAAAHRAGGHRRRSRVAVRQSRRRLSGDPAGGGERLATA